MQQKPCNATVALHKLIHGLAGCDLDRTPYVADWKLLARADFDFEAAFEYIAESKDKKHDPYLQAKFSTFGTLLYDEALSTAKRALGVL